MLPNCYQEFLRISAKSMSINKDLPIHGNYSELKDFDVQNHF